MKDQYFGDFGDYQKVSLLQKLNTEGLKVTTYWMKTLDDKSTDGKHITYLEKPNLWRSYEAEIFDFLNEKIKSKKRLLSFIENSSYCKGINFITEHIENLSIRDAILKRICSDNTQDIIFFDPDNGIEVASTNKKNLHKYVTWNEIIKTYKSGKSVLIYQHFSRSNREVFIKDKIKEIKQRIDTSILSLQVRHSVYFFIYNKKHKKRIEQALKEFTSIWEQLAITSSF